MINKDNYFSSRRFVLPFIIMIVIILTFTELYMMEKNITNLECYVGIISCPDKPVLGQENPLSGWTEECIENKTIENWQLIEPDMDCATVCEIETKCKDTGQGITCSLSMYGDRINCFEECRTAEKPYIRWWNETVCTKKMLVKEI